MTVDDAPQPLPESYLPGLLPGLCTAQGGAIEIPRMETSMRPLLRLAAAGTTALALALAPAAVATAAPASVAADDKPRETVSLTTEQRTAVIAARKAYIASATAAKRAYRSAVDAAMAKARAQVEGQALAVEQAKDAYRVTAWSGGDTAAAKAELEAALTAYRTAWSAAKDAVKGDIDAATTTAKNALASAKSTYEAALATAFGGAGNVPSALLNPPGGWGKGMHDRPGMGDWGRGGRR